MIKWKNIALTQPVAECHRKIDPLGFALENFDAIGRYRSTYGPRKIIDASGFFLVVKNLRILENSCGISATSIQEFARALTNKLMEYALGRRDGDIGPT